VLVRYPRGKESCSLDDSASLVKDVAGTDTENAAHVWSDSNSGPLPASKTPERVAEVCALITNKDTQND